MSTDRNLLFGVLALQADLIDAGAFVEACTIWTTRKHTSMADLLVERGWLLPTDRAHLDYLLERKLARHGGDARASLAAVGDDVKRSLAALGDADIQQSLAGIPATLDPCAHPTVDYVPFRGDRYQLTRLHATGGIGRVWLARDGDLGRDVAFKELRPERADNAGLWKRFLQEARITGQLEHPGIVPVYELGTRPDNQPFYTMRFVKGRTLSEAARAFNQKRAVGQADPLDLPVLLNAFVMVCNTVAYAHSRGVIHRDLKGQNVILGDFGEVVVLDWGLAKLVGRPEDATEASVVVLDAAGADSGYTVQGQALGTPAYMAPEQSAGRLDLINRRTDVYGLGAILYEVLTGAPPFSGPSTDEVLRRVREEEPAPPRQLWPDVPPALEALCLRALAKRSEDRPAAAADLAQEVQGWQEFERRKAEEALRRQTEILQSILDSMSDGVSVMDEKGEYLLWNRAAEEIVGLDLQEVSSVKATEQCFYLPDRVTPFVPEQLALRRAMRGEIVDDVEVFIRHSKKPEGVFVSVNSRPLKDAQGVVCGGVSVFRDITARKHAEEELRKSRERFELAVLGSQDGLWDWDVEADQVWYSPRLRAMLGYDEQEYPNRPGETEKRVHPDDHQRWRAALHGHVTGLTDHLEMEYRVRHKDGSFRWIRARGVALRRADGKAYRIAGSSEDISERKRAEEALRASEERYRSIIAAMQDGIIILNAEGSITSCNVAAERILGLSAEQIMGRTPHDPRWQSILEDGSPTPGDTNPAMVTLRTGRPCTDVIMGVHKPDGTLTWITVNAQPLFQEDNKTLAGVVASFEDISERKRIEEQLRQTTAELAMYRQQLPYPRD